MLLGRPGGANAGASSFICHTRYIISQFSPRVRLASAESSMPFSARAVRASFCPDGNIRLIFHSAAVSPLSGEDQIQRVLQHHGGFRTGNGRVRGENAAVRPAGGQPAAHGRGQIRLQPAGAFVAVARILGGIVRIYAQRSNQHSQKFSTADLLLGWKQPCSMIRPQKTGILHPFGGEAQLFPSVSPFVWHRRLRIVTVTVASGIRSPRVCGGVGEGIHADLFLFGT